MIERHDKQFAEWNSRQEKIASLEAELLQLKEEGGKDMPPGWKFEPGDKFMDDEIWVFKADEFSLTVSERHHRNGLGVIAPTTPIQTGAVFTDAMAMERTMIEYAQSILRRFEPL